MSKYVLIHYGTKRHSGRYPYGSGKRPYQSEPVGRRKIKGYTTPFRERVITGTLSHPQMRAALSVVIPPLAVANLVSITKKVVRDGQSKVDKARIGETLSEMRRKPEADSSSEDSFKKDLFVVNGTRIGINNCTGCSIAFEARRRGYDVVARGMRVGLDQGEIRNMFKPPLEMHHPLYTSKNYDKYSEADSTINPVKRKRLYEESFAEFCKDIEMKSGDGSRGLILVDFAKLMSGHCFSYQVKDGKVEFFDPQLGKTNIESHFALSEFPRTTWARLDNAEFNESVTSVMASRKGR